jgi:hypothetical protein
MGPEAIQQYINPEEVVKRLAAAQGIDVLNLVKSMEEVQQMRQQDMQQQAEMEAVKNSPQMVQAQAKMAETMAQQEQLPEGEPQQPPTPQQ